jgi:hypothetical protein
MLAVPARHHASRLQSAASCWLRCSRYRLSGYRGIPQDSPLFLPRFLSRVPVELLSRLMGPNDRRLKRVTCRELVVELFCELTGSASCMARIGPMNAAAPASMNLPACSVQKSHEFESAAASLTRPPSPPGWPSTEARSSAQPADSGPAWPQHYAQQWGELRPVLWARAGTAERVVGTLLGATAARDCPNRTRPWSARSGTMRVAA